VGKTPDEFAFDLYKLLVVAKDDLPSVAHIYHDCTANSASALAGVDAAMTRPAYFGGSLGPVHDSWVALHDAVQKILEDTGINLDDTATALDQAARQYEATDTAAAKALRDLIAQDGDPGRAVDR